MMPPISSQQFDLDALTAEQFSIGETRFFIRKMGAMEGFRLYEEIRQHLGQIDAAQSLKSELDMASAVSLEEQVFMAFVGVLLKLETGFVESVRKKLFKTMRYSVGQDSHGENNRQPLLEEEDVAFNGLGPDAVYELLVRGLAVNFTQSIRRVLQKLSAPVE